MLKPALVIEILLVMLLAGVGTAFAVEPGTGGPNGTPGPIPTAVPGSDYLTPSEYVIIYDDALMNVTGVTVTVQNKDSVAHSGTVNVAVDQDDETVTGSATFSDLAAGSSTEVTVNIGPVLIQDTYLQTLRVVVVKTQ